MQSFQVISLTLEEFTILVRTIVNDCLANQKITLRNDRTLNIQQACRFLNISAPTLRRYIEELKIRSHKLGPRRVMFYQSELEEDIKRLPGKGN